MGAALDDEITTFAATYAPRPGSLLDAGPTPGLSELKTSYDALAYHFARYGDDTAEPLSDELASTVLRNAVAARKRIKRAIAAKGRWPACGDALALGSRVASCSTF